MTRVRKSLTIAAFGYVQMRAIVSGVLLVPLTLRSWSPLLGTVARER